MRTLADYTSHDLTTFQTEAEIQAYRDHLDRWQSQLHPNGELECWFAAEIARATWRLQQYQPLGPAETAPDEARTSWLRYRDRTTLGIRRNLEELRRLQSDRYLQTNLGILLPGVASLKLVLPGPKLPKQQSDNAKQPPKPEPADINRSEAILHAQIQDEERHQLAEFGKTQPEPVAPQATDAPKPSTLKPSVPRNAPCPCASGHKYKLCCGHWSKTSPPKAA